MLMCFRLGLYRQGLLHDLSKYNPVEFFRGCKYYQGDRSPNNKEREIKGLSESWLHHKGRNKHHFEYWIDYEMDKPGYCGGMLMPRRYVAEMFCDRVAACKTYEKEKYTDYSAAIFFFAGPGRMLMHDTTRRETGYLLAMLCERGERETVRYIKHQYLAGAPVPESYDEDEMAARVREVQRAAHT